MARWGSADFRQLQKLRDKLEKLQRADMQRFCVDASRELAARLLALVIPRTPVGKKPTLKQLGGEGAKKTYKVKGSSGQSRTMLSREGAILSQYWDGYMGGTLRRGWTARTEAEAAGGTGRGSASDGVRYAQSLPVTQGGGVYQVTVKNPVQYASYVEFGHRQRPGRYVPQIGKRLKAGWVQGCSRLSRGSDNTAHKRHRGRRGRGHRRMEYPIGAGCNRYRRYICAIRGVRRHNERNVRHLCGRRGQP